MIGRGMALLVAILSVPALAVCLILFVQGLFRKSGWQIKRRGIAMLAVLVALAASAYILFFDMQSLPEGELLASYPSPNGTYRMDMYLCNGGATTDFAVRGAVVNTQTGRSRNIYWQYHQHDAEAVWTDEETVLISGTVLGDLQSMALNVTKDKYDYRNARK